MLFIRQSMDKIYINMLYIKKYGIEKATNNVSAISQCIGKIEF